MRSPQEFKEMASQMDKEASRDFQGALFWGAVGAVAYYFEWPIILGISAFAATVSMVQCACSGVNANTWKAAFALSNYLHELNLQRIDDDHTYDNRFHDALRAHKVPSEDTF